MLKREFINYMDSIGIGVNYSGNKKMFYFNDDTFTMDEVLSFKKEDLIKKLNMQEYYFDVMFGKTTEDKNSDFSHYNVYYFGKKDTFKPIKKITDIKSYDISNVASNIKTGEKIVNGFDVIFNPLLDENYSKNVYYKDFNDEIIKKTQKSGLSLDIIQNYKKDIKKEIDDYNNELFDIFYKEFIWDNISDAVESITLKNKLTKEQLNFIEKINIINNIEKKLYNDNVEYSFSVANKSKEYEKEKQQLLKDNYVNFTELIDKSKSTGGYTDEIYYTLSNKIDKIFNKELTKYEYDENYDGTDQTKNIKSKCNIIENQKKVIFTFSKETLKTIRKFRKLNKKDISEIVNRFIIEGFNVKINGWTYMSEFVDYFVNEIKKKNTVTHSVVKRVFLSDVLSIDFNEDYLNLNKNK